MRRWYDELWRKGKNDTIHKMIAPDARLRGQNGPDEEITGPQEFQAFAERIRKAFPKTEVEIEDIFAADDKVAIRWLPRVLASSKRRSVAWKNEGSKVTRVIT